MAFRPVISGLFIFLLLFSFKIQSSFDAPKDSDQKKEEDLFIWGQENAVPGALELYRRGEESFDLPTYRRQRSSFEENSLNSIFNGLWSLSPKDQGFDSQKFRLAYDIPVDGNGLVRKYIDYFAGPGNKYYKKWLGRLRNYRSYIIDQLRSSGVPEDTVSLAFIESGMNPKAVSRSKAVGIWQFMSFTGKRFGLRVGPYIDERMDPVKSTAAAIKYLKFLFGRFGDWRLAWASYNAGEGKIGRAIKKYGTRDFWEMIKYPYLARETKGYVPKIMAVAQLLAEESFSKESYLSNMKAFKLKGCYKIKDLIRATGLREKKFKTYNPHLFASITPPEVSFSLYLPKAQEFSPTSLKKLKQVSPKRLVFHKVKWGETLSQIALKYGSSVKKILSDNGIKHMNRVRSGQRLRIYLNREGLALPIKIKARPKRSKSFYTVKAGDNLWTLSKALGIKKGQLLKANPSIKGKNARIFVGQRLRLPGKPQKRKVRKKLFIKKGDSLWTISRKYKISLKELKRLNPKRTKLLKVGDFVYIQ